VSAVLDAALQYAECGWRVLPLRGKVATLKAWPDRASTDPATIRDWYAAEPDADLGVLTGDGLAVLDVDPRHRGDGTLDAYLHNSGAELPETPEVATGGGGRHLYLAASEGTRCRCLGPGLDLKAAGGYVVAPPSVHASGRQYVWHPTRPASLPLAELPNWAGTHTYEGHRPRPEGHWSSVAREGFQRGERNAGATSYCGHLLRSSLDPEEAFEVLRSWNRTRNRPPLSEGELERVFVSIARREAAGRRGGNK
jgi:hypothetical protein